MVWDKNRIVEHLRKLHRKGVDLSYNALAAKNQKLLSAAAYHYGSYRSAVEQAGIEYSQVLRRPRWTKQGIIQLIKQGRKKGWDLHWSAVTRRRDELGKAAFASIQPRLFGTWDRALHAAGLDADEVSCYRNWDKATVVFELRSRAADAVPMNSGAMQKDDPSLHAAAVRYFGSYDKALLAAKLDPGKCRQRKRWSKEAVVKSLKMARKTHRAVSDSIVRRSDPALYGAAIRLFGSFRKALKAAGVK